MPQSVDGVHPEAENGATNRNPMGPSMKGGILQMAKKKAAKKAAPKKVAKKKVAKKAKAKK